jgi:hypothetical protein
MDATGLNLDTPQERGVSVQVRCFENKYMLSAQGWLTIYGCHGIVKKDDLDLSKYSKANIW